MMIDSKLKEVVETLTPEMNSQFRDDFFSRLDPEYFSLFSPDEIAGHLKLSAGVNGNHPVRCQIRPVKKNLLNIVIAGYDYFSEFSLFCGLITSFGLDIESGQIFTFSEASREESRKRIIDIFQVSDSGQTRFDPEAQRTFEKELETLVTLLDQNQLPRARETVNQQVVEYLSRIQTPLIRKIYPVKIKFNYRLSDQSTLMEIESRDTPAFLYAFSNALSMQNIHIDKVTIESRGKTAHDRIFISHARGGAIKGKKEEEILKFATSLTKQFTYFLASAPNPVKGIQFFDRLLEKIMERGLSASVISFLNREKTLDLLARLLGTSEFLFEDFLQMHLDDLLPILKNFQKEKLRPGKKRLKQNLLKAVQKSRSLEEKKKKLNQFKDRELFRIDLKHLLAPKRDLAAFSLALTELAEVVLEEVYRIGFNELTVRFGIPRLEKRKACPFAICGLGKFGGEEMGYASDIELLLVYGGEGETDGKTPISNQEFYERLGQELLNLIEAKREGIFHVDLRLRPYGSKGSLSSSLSYLETYYHPDGGAAPFERQALTKLRWVAGDKKLGREVEALRDRFTYSGAPWDLKTALDLRQRQVKELVQPGILNVKQSPGGVVDLEYAVQYFQILHGHDAPRLRTPTTLKAVKGLHQTGLISETERKRFFESYLFLRNLVDALRVVRGNARDLILPDRSSEEFKYLARRMGHLSPEWEKGAKELENDIQRNMHWARQFFIRHFGTKH